MTEAFGGVKPLEEAADQGGLADAAEALNQDAGGGRSRARSKSNSGPSRPMNP